MTDTKSDSMELVLRVEGQVTESNFTDYKEQILARIDQVNLKPVTDEELATAEQTVKLFSKAEKTIDEAREKAMAETADIRDLFATMTDVADKLRDTRLALSKEVKTAKEKRKQKIIHSGAQEVQEYINKQYTDFNFLPNGIFHVVDAEFLAAVKGKKKLETIQAAVDARVVDLEKKIDETVELCRVNS